MANIITSLFRRFDLLKEEISSENLSFSFLSLLLIVRLLIDIIMIFSDKS